ncbi:MAG: YggT family protein [Campylobacteraceae bacterium]
MILQNFLIALADTISIAVNIYIWIIIISALISWVQPNPYNPVVQFLYKLTAPVYRLVKRFIPTVIGGIDLSPIVIILALQFLNIFLVGTLRSFAYGM